MSRRLPQTNKCQSFGRTHFPLQKCCSKFGWKRGRDKSPFGRGLSPFGQGMLPFLTSWNCQKRRKVKMCLETPKNVVSLKKQLITKRHEKYTLWKIQVCNKRSILCISVAQSKCLVQVCMGLKITYETRKMGLAGSADKLRSGDIGRWAWIPVFSS